MIQAMLRKKTVATCEAHDFRGWRSLGLRDPPTQVRRKESCLMDEYTLLQRGPSAVTELATSSSVSTLNWHVLGEACGREARGAESTALAGEWTEAAIACYSRVANSQSDRVTRQGLELSAYGLRAAHIIRVGGSTATAARYLAETRSWIKDGLRAFENAFALKRAVTNFDDKQRADALWARERLQVGSALRRSVNLLADLDPWFHAAGLETGGVPT